MSNCVSHEGNYTDDDQPLDEFGNLYRPGYRTCRHSDCINPRHIIKPVEADKWEAVYAEVIALGNKPFMGGTQCRVTGCPRKHKGRNLCANHWQMFARQQPHKLVHHEKLPPEAFINVPPAQGNGRRKENRECLIEGCAKEMYSRNLCATHHRRFNRLKKATA